MDDPTTARVRLGIRIEPGTDDAIDALIDHIHTAADAIGIVAHVENVAIRDRMSHPASTVNDAPRQQETP